nr:hypothetical protein [Streptomyces spinoverrucosus]
MRHPLDRSGAPEAEDERVPCAKDRRPCAAGFVARVTTRNRLPLDYSVASLRVVDFAHVGEVFVRRAGAMWADFDAGRRAYFGRPVYGCRTGGVRNPLGKVRNHFDIGGPGDSLQTFHPTLHGRAGRAAA